MKFENIGKVLKTSNHLISNLEIEGDFLVLLSKTNEDIGPANDKNLSYF